MSQMFLRITAAKNAKAGTLKEMSVVLDGLWRWHCLYLKLCHTVPQCANLKIFVYQVRTY